MAWIPIAAWIVAVVVALGALGYCAYEISWKAKRLRTDLGQLAAVTDQLPGLRGRLAETQKRLAETRERLAAGGLG